MDAGESLSGGGHQFGRFLGGNAELDARRYRKDGYRADRREPFERQKRTSAPATSKQRRRCRVLLGSWSSLSRAEAGSLHPTPFHWRLSGGCSHRPGITAKTARFFDPDLYLGAAHTRIESTWDLWPLAAETAKEPTSRSLVLVSDPPQSHVRPHNLELASRRCPEFGAAVFCCARKQFERTASGHERVLEMMEDEYHAYEQAAGR